MTLLDELNELLRKSKLDIPEHVRSVSSSGRNLKWLRKNLADKPGTPERMSHLLKLEINQLSKPAPNSTQYQELDVA